MCLLKTARSLDTKKDEKLQTSVAIVEYANGGVHCSACNYRIKENRFSQSAVYHSEEISDILFQFGNKRPFSNFVKSSAKKIKKKLMQRSSKGRKFVTIHLRTTDRPCMIRSYTPKNLLMKLKSFNILAGNSVVYLHTDGDRAAFQHISMLRKEYSPHFHTTMDIAFLQKHRLFRDSNLAFAVDLELQSEADLVVESYAGHFNFLKENIKYLAPSHCR